MSDQPTTPLTDRHWRLELRLTAHTRHDVIAGLHELAERIEREGSVSGMATRERFSTCHTLAEVPGDTEQAGRWLVGLRWDGVPREVSTDALPALPEPGRECEHGSLRRSCDRCADADEIAALRAEVEALRAFFNAVRNLNNTIGHPSATAEDERKAEDAYHAARDRVSALDAARAEAPRSET